MPDHTQDARIYIIAGLIYGERNTAEIFHVKRDNLDGKKRYCSTLFLSSRFLQRLAISKEKGAASSVSERGGKVV